MIGQLKIGRRFLFRYALALALALCAIAACNNTLNEYKDGSYFVGSQRMITWAKTYGGSFEDAAMAITQTSDGGYAVAGYSFSNDGDVTGNHGMADFWVVKVDSDGNLQWQRNYGGSEDDRAYDIKQTADGGFILVGNTKSTNGDITVESAHHGGYDIWVLKIDALGDIQWQRCFGGSLNDYGTSIQIISSGYVVAGYALSSNGNLTGNNGSADVWVFTIDNTGTLTRQANFGGPATDSATSIQQTSDGGYIVAAHTQSNSGDVSGNNGAMDAWIIKLNSSLSITNSTCLGGTLDDQANAIRQTGDGGYIVAGYANSGNGDVVGQHNAGTADQWVVKLSGSLAIQWQRCLGGSSNDFAEAVRIANDGGYIVAGYTSSSDGDIAGKHGQEDVWIVKLTASGAIQWGKCFGGDDNDRANSVYPASDGGFIVAGYSNSTNGDVTFNHGISDFFLVKVNDWGNW